MKKLLLVLALMLTTAIAISAQSTYTNGFIYTDYPIECHLVSAHNGTLTNYLEAGISYMTGNAILEFSPTNLTSIYLSGGIIILSDANSKFSIDIFEQEILNLSDTPRKAKFGNYNLAITIQEGTIAISSVTNDYSAISLSAQESAFQLSGGKFVFDVTTNGIVSYTKGNCKRIFTNHAIDNTGKKGAEILIQREFQLTSTELYAPNKKQIELYNKLVSSLNISTNVEFIVIQGKLIGIWTK